MQTLSSASRTCFKLLSADECTATVLIPSSRQARCIRRAISPRFAMTIFSSMKVASSFSGGGGSTNHEQNLAKLYRFAIFYFNGGDFSGGVGFDLIHHFHGLDDAQRIAYGDFIADFHKGLGIG